VGLLAELAQDFSKPTSRITKSNVAIYLDSPIAHDLVGASGRQAAQQARSVVKKLQEMGASINIFDQSIKEMQLSLRTILAKDPADRFGAIQEAFLRGELDEAYVYTLIADPARALKEWGVQIKSQSTQNALRPDHFFTHGHYSTFNDKLLKAQWSNDARTIARCRHDANAVAYIMRLRKGHESDDMFATNHLFLTRNRTFASLARRFCVSEDLISDESVGPFVNMHDLAASLWLRTGLYETSFEIPRRQLLVGCERVLALKSGVIQKAQRAILRLRERPDIDAEKMRQMEAILSQDRSRILISDRIRGAHKEVSDDDLIDIYKRVLADEETKGIQKGRLEIAEDRDRIAREKSKIEEVLAETQDASQLREAALSAELEVAQERVAVEAAEKRRRLNTLVIEVNDAINSRNKVIISILASLSLLLVLASFWKEILSIFGQQLMPATQSSLLSPSFLLVCALLSPAVAFIDQVFRLLGHERPIKKLFIERWAIQHFLRKVEERGLSGLLGANPQDKVHYRGGRVIVDE
jgi:hypothetical protein